MNKLILGVIFLIMLMPNSFADRVIKKKDINTIVYESTENITYFPQKQAKLLLNLMKKYPNWEKYEIIWENINLTGKLIYIPKFKRLYFLSILNNAIQGQEIYIGKIEERLKKAADGKSEFFDFKNDAFKREDNTSYLIAPGFKK